jgi:nucleoside-diphosphate-sugar epimerase
VARTVLITGAAGYVGGALTGRLLADGETTVIAVDALEMAHGDAGLAPYAGSGSLEVIKADVRDTEALRPLVRRADAVVHLAAIVGDPAGRRDPELTREVNTKATIRLAECGRDEDVGHFVFVSTCSNYGVADGGTAVDEDAPLNPVSLYAESKVAVERFLASADDIPSTCLRLATVYGVAPRMRFDLTVNQFTLEAHTDRRLAIYGEQFWRPYVHVDDVARAIVSVLGSPERSIGRTFNVGDSDENYTKRMLFELLADRVEPLHVDWVSVDEDPRSYRVDFARVREELGFEVSRRVPDGMDELLRRLRVGEYADASAERYRN